MIVLNIHCSNCLYWFRAQVRCKRVAVSSNLSVAHPLASFNLSRCSLMKSAVLVTFSSIYNGFATSTHRPFRIRAPAAFINVVSASADAFPTRRGCKIEPFQTVLSHLVIYWVIYLVISWWSLQLSRLVSRYVILTVMVGRDMVGNLEYGGHEQTDSYRNSWNDRLSRYSNGNFFASIPLCCLRELPYMMSSSEGEGGSWKGGHRKGGCLNFIV